jgi:hypothetical protein
LVNNKNWAITDGGQLSYTTWNGTTWDNGTPGTIIDAYIDGDYTTSASLETFNLIVNEGNSFTADHPVNVNGNLILKSGSTGSASLLDKGNMTVAGSTTVQQYLTNGRWWYISPQINNANAGDDLLVDGSAYHLYYWKENNGGTDGWTPVTAGNTLDAANGYAYYNNSGAPITGSFEGTMNTGIMGATDNLTRTTGAYKEGFNLVGNPYPSAIDWGAENAPTTGLTKTNVDNTIWIRKDGNFATYNWSGDGTSQNGGSQYIAPGQAFWVKVADGQSNGTYSLTNETRLHSSQPLLKDNETHVFRLELSNGQQQDETVIGFYNQAENSYDQYDSEKMFTNNLEYPQVYTVVEGKEVAINGNEDNWDKQKVVPLGYRAKHAGEFTFEATNIKEFKPGVSVYLIDKLENTTIELTEKASYTFFTDVTTNNTSRFELVFTKETAGIGETSGNSTYVFANGQSIFINAPFNGDVIILINDITGRVLHKDEIQLVEGLNSIHPGNVQTGIYFITLVSKNTHLTKKVVLR